MQEVTKKAARRAKKEFSDALQVFVSRMQSFVSTDHGEWTVKGFIDIYRNIYTISIDTKIISKILEIHLFPQILQLAEEQRYSIVLAEHQNWYPDLSFVNQSDPRIRFAVDLKTTYRDPKFPGHVNGFTLGSHGAYFRDRTSSKNIQFPYGTYLGHFCLGIIYSRADMDDVAETEIIHAQELGDVTRPNPELPVKIVKGLRCITSVIKDFQFFVCEKWQLASDRQGSGNTANIGSITAIEDIVKGNGVFAKLGEKWFDEYWMNYGMLSIKRDDRAVPIRRLEDFVDFKGGSKELIVPIKTKRKKENISR